MENLIIVRGGGDLATGSIYKLVKCGFPVLILEIEHPSAIRRNVAFSEAIYEGQQTVEDVTCYRAESLAHAVSMLEEKKLAILHDPDGHAISELRPMAVVDANNELRMLASKEEHEIERILATFSGDVAASSPSLILNHKNITELAFAFGCAELSRKLNCVEPELNSKQKIVLKRARHPLIDKDKVIPISVSLGESFDTLVITGPNTGGKTVTL